MYLCHINILHIYRCCELQLKLRFPKNNKKIFINHIQLTYSSIVNGKKCPKKNKKDVHKTYIDLQNCGIGIAMEIKFPKNNKKILYIHLHSIYQSYKLQSK